MSNSNWRQSRSNSHWALQWRRRVDKPLPFILQEVHERMVSRAQVMRPPEGDVVVQGWLHPELLPNLGALFANRSIHLAVPHHDQVSDLFTGASSKRSLTFLSKLLPTRRTAAQAGEFVPLGLGQLDSLGLESSTVSMVWSPMWLFSATDVQAVFEEWSRVLKLQGGVFFSTLGPDSASVLAGVASELGLPFADFVDMHDVGDQLGQVGFSDPVMEMEKIQLTYADAAKLLAEWHALVGNHLVDRACGLKGRGFYAQVLSSLEKHRQVFDSRLVLELEVIYGHAWKVKPKLPPGHAMVPVSSIQRKRG